VASAAESKNNTKFKIGLLKKKKSVNYGLDLKTSKIISAWDN